MVRSRYVRVASLLASLLLGGSAAAQYLPTPPPDLTIDAEGNNIGCARAGYTNCGGYNSSNTRPAPPPKPDVWGAVAMSPGAAAWGVSWNHPTEAAASAEAMKYCRANKDGAGCKVVRTVADVCLALVLSAPEKVAVVSTPGPATNFSEDNGKLLCQRAGGHSCQVLKSFCADGINHQIRSNTVFTPSGNPIFVPEGQSVPGRTTRR